MSITVRAKFKCTSIEEFEGGNKQAHFTALTSGSDENKDFARYTPSGDLRIQISEGLPAAGFFEPGKAYYLDFTEAPK